MIWTLCKTMRFPRQRGANLRLPAVASRVGPDELSSIRRLCGGVSLADHQLQSWNLLCGRVLEHLDVGCTDQVAGWGKMASNIGFQLVSGEPAEIMLEQEFSSWFEPAVEVVKEARPGFRWKDVQTTAVDDCIEVPKSIACLGDIGLLEYQLRDRTMQLSGFLDGRGSEVNPQNLHSTFRQPGSAVSETAPDIEAPLARLQQTTLEGIDKRPRDSVQFPACGLSTFPVAFPVGFRITPQDSSQELTPGCPHFIGILQEVLSGERCG